jgi:hypothetical protein
VFRRTFSECFTEKKTEVTSEISFNNACPRGEREPPEEKGVHQAVIKLLQGKEKPLKKRRQKKKRKVLQEYVEENNWLIVYHVTKEDVSYPEVR